MQEVASIQNLYLIAPGKVIIVWNKYEPLNPLA